MIEKDVQETRERYRERWLTFGYDPRTLGWNKGRQWVRFAAAFEGVLPEDSASVLDIGCGFGDLLPFLWDRKWGGMYRGIDLVPELIEEGRRRFGGTNVEFECRDISATGLGARFDMALALGVFNHKLSHQDNMAFVESMFGAMWESTTRLVVLDFLSDTADKKREGLFYADPAKLFDLARRFSRRIVIHHGYMPFEFQLKVWHNDSFKVEHPVFEPYEPLVQMPVRETPP